MGVELQSAARSSLALATALLVRCLSIALVRARDRRRLAQLVGGWRPAEWPTRRPASERISTDSSPCAAAAVGQCKAPESIRASRRERQRSPAPTERATERSRGRSLISPGHTYNRHDAGLPRSRGDDAAAPRSPRRDAAAADGGFRQPVVRTRQPAAVPARHSTRRASGPRRAQRRAARDHLHRRRHGGDQPRAQGRRLGGQGARQPARHERRRAPRRCCTRCGTSRSSASRSCSCRWTATAASIRTSSTRRSTTARLLVSLMLANNEVGTVQPLADLVRRVRAHAGVAIHVDAVQAAPYMALDVRRAGRGPALDRRAQVRGPQGHWRALPSPRHDPPAADAGWLAGALPAGRHGERGRRVGMAVALELAVRRAVRDRAAARRAARQAARRAARRCPTSS